MERLLSSEYKSIDEEKKNDIIKDEWENELYTIKHKYKMLSILDEIRYLKQLNFNLPEEYIDIEKQNNNLTKSDILSKISDFKIIFSNVNIYNNQAMFMLYLHQNENRLINPFQSKDENYKEIYRDFCKLKYEEELELLKSSDEFTYKNLDYDAIEYLYKMEKIFEIAEEDEINRYETDDELFF